MPVLVAGAWAEVQRPLDLGPQGLEQVLVLERVSEPIGRRQLVWRRLARHLGRHSGRHSGRQPRVALLLGLQAARQRGAVWLLEPGRVRPLVRPVVKVRRKQPVRSLQRGQAQRQGAAQEVAAQERGLALERVKAPAREAAREAAQGTAQAQVREAVQE